MTKSIFRIGTILVLGLAALQTTVLAQDTNTIVGVWALNVNVTDCHGTFIRAVNSLQIFSRDGTFSETANTFLRGSSVGVWSPAGNQSYSAHYWFYRYQPTGAFASTAQAVNAIQLSPDGNHFTASGTIQDFNASNGLISTGCAMQSATRLAAPGMVPE